MSLPPGFLDELRSRTSLTQVVGRKVMWDPRKSNQGKGDMWAPCPFHQEKTASFHVDDRKGFYYCFGCHAKGDAITFVRETENVGFMEAVEILAREAGMTMPERDPDAARKIERRQDLASVMEEALRFFRLQLSTAAATEARAYLDRRRLTAQAIDRFELGFAPDNRVALWQHLTAKEIAPDRIIAAGLAAKPDDGGAPYDRFRGRIIFPIRDAQGRCIAFGGRAMSPQARAKYLNSPETELFDKSRSLYNHGPARTATGKDQTLIVAEGYMDTIALVEAGFEATVATLGTALTEQQLQLLWRLSPEPVIAMDGDAAGLRAAKQVIDRALPLLEAGQSLRFALMPEGLDPDDLIARDGAPAMQAVLDAALPMVALLWQRETEGKSFDSPERKAALEKSLAEAVAKIRDPAIRRHYQSALRKMQWEAFAAPPRRKGARRGAKGSAMAAAPSASARASRLAAQGDASDEIREAVILATLLQTPEVLPKFTHTLETLDFSTEIHRTLKDAILQSAGVEPAAFLAQVRDAVGAEHLDMLFTGTHVALAPGIRVSGQIEIAELCIAEELAKLEARRGLAREIAEATEDVTAGTGRHVAWRLAQASEARNRADRSLQEDSTEYEIGPNGAKMKRQEREAFDDLIRDIDFSKSRGN
ncbi:MAG: DNA primase [Pseudomonadota bacterium]